MADLYWKGGNNSPDTDDEKGNYNQALNWQTATGGAGSVPGAADVMHFDKRAGIVPSNYVGTKHTIGKHWNCYHNLANGPDDCQGVVVSPDFTGRIGTDAEDTVAALQLSLAATKKLIYRGNEPCHIKIKTAAKSVPLVIHDSVSGLLVLSSVNDTDTEYTKIECYGGGTLEVQDDTKVIEVHNYGPATVTIHEGCPAIKIYADGGSVFSDSPLDAVENYGGAIVLGNTALAVAQAAIDIASLLNVDGSFTWRAGGKMTACEQRGDATITVVGDGDKQVGNSGDIFKLLGGTFDASGQTGKFTKGATCGILIRDATFIPPKGFQIDDWSL